MSMMEGARRPGFPGRRASGCGESVHFFFERRDVAFFAFAPCFPSAVLVFFGPRFSVCLRLAAVAAFLTVRFAAVRGFDVATANLLDVWV
ncbi:MAG: hypothetical protein NW701_14810 [Nitrospira sp.]